MVFYSPSCAFRSLVQSWQHPWQYWMLHLSIWKFSNQSRAQWCAQSKQFGGGDAGLSGGGGGLDFSFVLLAFQGLLWDIESKPTVHTAVQRLASMPAVPPKYASVRAQPCTHHQKQKQNTHYMGWWDLCTSDNLLVQTVKEHGRCMVWRLCHLGIQIDKILN